MKTFLIIDLAITVYLLVYHLPRLIRKKEHWSLKLATVLFCFLWIPVTLIICIVGAYKTITQPVNPKLTKFKEEVKDWWHGNDI